MENFFENQIVKMIRKILIALLLLLIIAAGVAAYAAYNANSLIAKYKPDLERIASQAVGAKVTLGELTTSVFPETTVEVKKAEVSSGGSSEKLSLNNLSLHLKLLPLLTGRMEITELSLKDPEIVIVKDAEGIRIPGIPHSSHDSSNPEVAPKQSPSTKESSEVPLAVNLRKLSLSNASVLFRDTQASKEYHLKDISLVSTVDLSGSTAAISDLSLSGTALSNTSFSASAPSATFDLHSGGLEIPKVLIKFAGNSIDASVSMKTKEGLGNIKISSPSIALDSFSQILSELNPDQGPLGLSGEIVPAIQVKTLPKSFQATGTVGIKGVGLKAGPYQISNTTGTMTLATDSGAQTFKSQDIKLSIGGQPISVNLSAEALGSRVTMNEVKISGFGGSIASSGSVELSSEKPFDSNFTVSSLEIDEIMGLVAPGDKMKLFGNLNKATGKISGSVGPNLMNSLRGPVTFQVTNGGVRGVNLGARVLQAVDKLPILTGPLWGYVPPSQKGSVSGDDTIIQQMTGTVSLGGGSMTTKDIRLVSTTYTIDADGRIGFNGNLDLNANITFTPEFSQALVGAIKELRAILDDNGRLTFPLTIQGTVPKVVVVPNLSRLLEGAGKKLLKEKAADAIDKALGGGGGAKKAIQGLFGF